MPNNNSTNNGDYNIVIQGVSNNSNVTVHQNIAFDKQSFLADLHTLLHPEKPIFVMVLTSTASKIRERLNQETDINFSFEDIANHYTDDITEWKPYVEEETMKEILRGFENTYNCKLSIYFIDCQDDMPTQNFLDEIKLHKQNIIWLIDNFSLLSEGNSKIIQQFDHIYIGGCFVPKADCQSNRDIAKFIQKLQQKSFPSLWNYKKYSDTIFNGKLPNSLRNIKFGIDNSQDFKLEFRILIEDNFKIKLQATQIGIYGGKTVTELQKPTLS
jgi:hypothetical protein